VKFTLQALTPELWPAFEDLFEGNWPVKACWCMYWRIGNAYHQQPHAANKAAFCEVVSNGPPPGLLAFDGDVAVGWCQLTPRADLPWLDVHTWRLKRVDEVPVWSLSCFYIRKGYRKQGVTAALIAEALKVAKRAKAPALEAYPLDGDLTSSTSFTGYTSTFLRAGFKVVARLTPSRPILRYEFKKSKVKSSAILTKAKKRK